MALFRRLRKQMGATFFLLLILILSSCGTAGNENNNTGNTGNKGTLTVAGKLDTEAQLLTKFYTLLLRKQGYTVNEKPALGNSTFVFNAITSGSIDIYPEFTATALNILKIPSTYDPQKDYQNVKDAFDKQYQLTWLDPAPLNDGYSLCMSKEQSQNLGITSISDLVGKASQLNLVSPSDGTDFVDGLQKIYNITTKSFKNTQTLDYALTFEAVKNNQAQVMICYGTDVTIPQGGFVFLKDDKNGFPAFNPAPIVRNDKLATYPDISTALNPLAPLLTTEVSLQLQTDIKTQHDQGIPVAKAVTDVATKFLQDKGLIDKA